MPYWYISMQKSSKLPGTLTLSISLDALKAFHISCCISRTATPLSIVSSSSPEHRHIFVGLQFFFVDRKCAASWAGSPNKRGFYLLKILGCDQQKLPYVSTIPSVERFSKFLGSDRQVRVHSTDSLNRYERSAESASASASCTSCSLFRRWSTSRWCNEALLAFSVPKRIPSRALLLGSRLRINLSARQRLRSKDMTSKPAQKWKRRWISC